MNWNNLIFGAISVLMILSILGLYSNIAESSSTGYGKLYPTGDRCIDTMHENYFNRLSPGVCAESSMKIYECRGRAYYDLVSICNDMQE